jgi:hypothetical protein
MTAVLDGTVSTHEAARMLDTTSKTVWYWASRWYPVGSGNRIRLTRVDLMVLRAYLAINGYGEGLRGGPGNHHLRRLAQTAIRSDPRPWLLLTRRHASTHRTPPDAITAWLALPKPRGATWIIPLGDRT